MIRDCKRLSIELTKINVIINKKTIDSNRIIFSEVAEFTKSVLKRTLDMFSHDLSFINLFVSESFEKGLERLYSHSLAPRIDPW